MKVFKGNIVRDRVCVLGTKKTTLFKAIKGLRMLGGKGRSLIRVEDLGRGMHGRDSSSENIVEEIALKSS